MDLADLRRPIPRGEQIARKERRFVGDVCGDAHQVGIGKGDARVLRLPAVDAAAERPAARGMRAVVHPAVAAEIALPAVRLYVDRHAVALFEGRERAARLLHHAHKLVPQRHAPFGARHGVVQNVQIARADARERHLHNGVARVHSVRHGLFGERGLPAPQIGICLHNPSFRMRSRMGLSAGQKGRKKSSSRVAQRSSQCSNACGSPSKIAARNKVRRTVRSG